MALIEACAVCRGKPLHRLGCPVLTRVTLVVATFFGVLTAMSIVSSLLDGPTPDTRLEIGITAFFAIYGIASLLRGRLDPPRE